MSKYSTRLALYSVSRLAIVYHYLANCDYKISWIGFSLRLLEPDYENSRNGCRVYSQVPVPQTTVSDKDLPTNLTI